MAWFSASKATPANSHGGLTIERLVAGYGGGIVIDGRVVTGNRGEPAELGAMVLDPAGRTSVRSATMITRAAHTPFDGFDVAGAMRSVFLRGVEAHTTISTFQARQSGRRQASDTSSHSADTQTKR